MNASDIQLSKPPAKAKTPNPAKAGNGQSRSQSQSRDGNPTQDQIAMMAYQIYVESGYQPGRDSENWLRAEQLLRARGSSQPASAGAGSGRQP